MVAVLGDVFVSVGGEQEEVRKMIVKNWSECTILRKIYVSDCTILHVLGVSDCTILHGLGRKLLMAWK